VIAIPGPLGDIVLAQTSESMISQKSFTVAGYVIVVFMAAMLVLVYFRLVPTSWYMAIFAVTLALFLLRIAMRLIMARQQRLEKERNTNTPTAPPPIE